MRLFPTRVSILQMRLLLLLALIGCRATPPDGVPTIEMPDNDPGIGFDDMRYSRVHNLILVPGGRSGYLDLVDPVTRRVDSIDGFSREIFYFGGGYQGATSADDGPDRLIYVSDRTPEKLHVVDPSAHAIIASRQVASGFDYIRYVEPTREVWMTEPDDERIEIFTIPADTRQAPDHAAYLPTPGGPESLVIDRTRGRAYTHVWGGSTYAIDIHTRAIVETWPNGCTGSRGIALDEPRGFLYVGCREGSAVTLDVTAGGKQLGRAPTGTGVDIIDYDAVRRHLYVPAGGSATLTILQVGLDGSLSVLGTRPAVEHAHCGAVMPSGPAVVCDPDNGELLVEEDPYP